MLTVCADGISRCHPILIFHGKEGVDGESDTPVREHQRYHPCVRVFFNKIAYSYGDITLRWLQDDICSMQSPFDRHQQPRLITLDAFSAQKTPAVASTSAVGERRIATTHTVAHAWSWLHVEKKNSIIKVFEQTGISLKSRS